MKKSDYDVVVVGAGIVGACFALSLARQTDLKIALLERGSAVDQQLVKENPNQRVVALGKLATELLSELGVFHGMSEASAFAYQKMFVWDESSDGELAFDAKDYTDLGESASEQSILGHMVDSMECNRLLQQAIAEQVNIDDFYQFQTDLLVMHPAHVEVGFGERKISSSLLVAADGAQSWVRQQSKIFSHRYDFAQRGIVARITTGQSHQNTAWQRFMATGPVAVLPLANNQSSIVWSADTGFAEALLAKPDEEFCIALAEALENRLGAATLLSKRVGFPLSSHRAEQYVKGRVVLIGDAAHSIHPLAGQGANLGFKDVKKLVQVISKFGSTLSSSQLAGYQRARRPDNEQTDWLMNTLNHAYKEDAAWWQSARGIGMNRLSAMPRVKALLARHAMGI